MTRTSRAPSASAGRDRRPTHPGDWADRVIGQVAGDVDARQQLAEFLRSAPDTPTRRRRAADGRPARFRFASVPKARRMASIRFSAVIFPNAANRIASSGTPSASRTRPRAAASRRTAPPRCPDGWPRSPRTGIGLAQISSDTRVVHRHYPRRLHDHPQHRPRVVNRPAESDDGILREAARGVGVVVPELAAVVVESLLLQQAARPRLVQPRVVQDDEAGEGGEVGPHVVVARRVTELIHDQIVGMAARHPQENRRVRLGKRSRWHAPAPRATRGGRRCRPRCRSGPAAAAKTTRGAWAR